MAGLGAPPALGARRLDRRPPCPTPPHPSPLHYPKVELQRIRVRQRHDPRINGNLEEAAQAGMNQLKTRNNKNRELDIL
jgi:hypothetical protein